MNNECVIISPAWIIFFFYTNLIIKYNLGRSAWVGLGKVKMWPALKGK